MTAILSSIENEESEKQPRFLIYFPGICHLMTDTALGSLAALLPLFMSSYGLNYEKAAAIIFANTALASVAQPFFGYLADKRPNHLFIPLGMTLAGCSIAALGFVHSYAAILFCSMLAGIGSAIFHPEAARWVNRISGAKKGRAMGYFAVGGNGGFAVGPILASLAYIIGPYALTIFALLTISMSIIYFMTISHHHSAKVKVIKQRQPVIERNDWRSFSQLFVIIAARSINFSVLNTFIPIYWITHLHQSTASGNFALSLFFFLGTVVTLLGGILSDKIGFVRIIRYCYLILVPAMILFTNSEYYWLSMLLLIPLSVGLFAQYSPIVVLGQQYLAKSVGFASGITLGLGITFGGMVSPLVGKAADIYGLQSAWLVLNLICIIALLFSFLIKDAK